LAIAIGRSNGNAVSTRSPNSRSIAIANRLFLHRVVRHLVRRGVRQFVDIGSGVPTMGNTHQVADEVAGDSRVVYIDNEPVAVAHSRVLLDEHGDPRRHAAINADLRDPDGLWEQVMATGVINPNEPLALLLIAVLHVRQSGPDGADMGAAAVARYRELLPAGSYLAISHITNEGVPKALDDKLVELKRMYDASSSPVIWRSQPEIRSLFGDFDVVEPGMTWTTLWHPEETGPNSPEIEFNAPEESVIWVGVGQKA